MVYNFMATLEAFPRQPPTNVECSQTAWALSSIKQNNLQLLKFVRV